MKKLKETFILLHNIRSAQNVGAIFRTADAAGISKIFLSGYTPIPTDRFGREVAAIAKAALGAERAVAWQKVASPSAVITQLKKKGAQVIAIEQDGRSVDYKKIRVRSPVLFVFGNEVTGLSPSILKRADVIAEIPMNGTKESLNVSVAAGIALFRMLGI